MCSNGYFWTYTVALNIVWIIVLATAIENESLSHSGTEDYEGDNNKNCKALCKQCGCLDFYCGEECICECNNDRSDTECIAIMQAKARTMNTPFEILIQGPTANNFVRNALRFEQNTERMTNGYRYRRSTITIYMPNKDRESSNLKPNHGGISKKNSIVKASKERIKRSTDNTYNWFSDLTNNLVRPAPLGIRKSINEYNDEYKTQFKDTERFVKPATFDKSWFLDDTPNILTPAPIIKQKISKSSSVLYKDSAVQSNVKSEIIRSPFSSYNEGTFRPLTVNKFDWNTNVEVDKTNSNEFGKSSAEEDVHINSLENKEIKDSQETLSSGLHARLFKDDTNKFQELLTTKLTKQKRIRWLKPIDFLEKIRRLLIV